MRPELPSIQSRVPWEDYAALEGTSITRLKEMRRSPLHFRHGLSNPLRSPALTLGSAAHVAVLEPERFERDHAVWGERTDGGRLRPRNGQDWEKFAEDNKGKRILTDVEYKYALAIQRAIRGNKIAMEYLQAGDPEVTMRWWSHNGRVCKGRVDWLTRIDGVRTIVGLKTVRDCRPYIFGSAAAKLGYHLQWAFYRDGYEAITERVARMVEIVVESEPPHAVVTYMIPNDIIEQGREEYVPLLERLEACEKANDWPGPCEGEQILTLPTWAYEQHDDISDLGLEVA